MSRTRKKKKNGLHQQQNEAAKRNYFLRELKQVLTQCGCENVYEILPGNVKKALYSIRASSLKIRQNNCECLPSVLIKEISDSLDEDCQTRDVQIGKTGSTISIKLFYTIGLNLRLLQVWLEEEEIPDAAKALKSMLEKMDLLNAEKKSKREILITSVGAGLTASNLRKHLVWIRFNLEMGSSNPHTNGLIYHINAVPAEQKRFKVNGSTRPAYRVGSFSNLAITGWSSIKRSVFEKPTQFNQISIPVYIQSHALHRFEERLDTLTMSRIEYSIHESIMNPKVVCFKGRYLVPFFYLGVKLGYLVSDIVDNSLLIRTFLLLTNNNTPEGERLKELSGLSKIDMKYWDIDRLSTFQQTDICENEELKSLFTKAGCKNLFSKQINFSEEKEELREMAHDMLEYIHQETA